MLTSTSMPPIRSLAGVDGPRVVVGRRSRRLAAPCAPVFCATSAIALLVAAGEDDLVTGLASQLDQGGADALAAAGDEEAGWMTSQDASPAADADRRVYQVRPPSVDFRMPMPARELKSSPPLASFFGSRFLSDVARLVVFAGFEGCRFMAASCPPLFHDLCQTPTSTLSFCNHSGFRQIGRAATASTCGCGTTPLASKQDHRINVLLR